MKSQNPIQESEERKISNSEAEKSLIFSFITFAVRRVEQSWYLFDLWCMFWFSLLITSLSFTAPNISFYITFHITKDIFSLLIYKACCQIIFNLMLQVFGQLAV